MNSEQTKEIHVQQAKVKFFLDKLNPI